MNEALVFESSWKKSIIWAAAFLLGAYLSSLAIPEMPILGWPFFIAFILGALCLLAINITKRMRIVATHDGVEIYGLHKPIKYKLEELSSFYISDFKGFKVLVISYNRSFKKRTLSSSALYGTDRFIFNFYKLPLEDLCEALNTRLQNFNVMQSNKSMQPTPYRGG